MSRGYRIVCGTPESECTGSTTMTGNNWRGSKRLHASREEAFECYKSHLLRNGYTQVGSREFRAPEGGILVLSKKSKFGGLMRWGKEKRFMPERTSGVIF